ncbi:MAG: hypothetical protein CMJ29_04560 [Phycisphaerae bacterium]|nr:hypothetical protein [Phycisphaerae bacterium]|tara:strand:- start:278 stop:508 length:231 start_codon:yes stop_codon:yes gene_type:complete
MMAESEKKSLMRCLGEFTGYIAKGIRTKVDQPNTEEVSRVVEETHENGVTLRRTVIEEVEYRDPGTMPGKDQKSCS